VIVRPVGAVAEATKWTGEATVEPLEGAETAIVPAVTALANVEKAIVGESQSRMITERTQKEIQLFRKIKSSNLILYLVEAKVRVHQLWLYQVRAAFPVEKGLSSVRYRT